MELLRIKHIPWIQCSSLAQWAKTKHFCLGCYKNLAPALWKCPLWQAKRTGLDELCLGQVTPHISTSDPQGHFLWWDMRNWMEEVRAKMSGKEEYSSPQEIIVRQRLQLPEQVILNKKLWITHFSPARSFGANGSAPAPEWLDILVAKFPGDTELTQIQFP